MVQREDLRRFREDGGKFIGRVFGMGMSQVRDGGSFFQDGDDGYREE